MKTMVVTLIAVSCLTAAGLQSNAQQNPYAVNASSGSAREVSGVNKAAAPVGVSNQVFTQFNRQFPNATEVAWTSTPESTTAYFKEAGISTRTTYNNGGALEYTFRYYTEKQAPQGVVNIVRRNNYSMNITQVIEVRKRKGSTVHYVQMEDVNDHLTLRVYADGSVEHHQQFSKAK